MARIRFSALIEDIRGSVGGTTIQGNAYGYTMRNKPRTAPVRSVNQNRSKLYIAGAVKAWSEIGDYGRNNWNVWAETNQQLAKHNPSAKLSGFSAFVRVNQQKFLRYGQATGWSDSPSDIIYPVDIPSWVVRTNGVSLIIEWTWALGQGANRANLFISSPVKATSNYPAAKVRFLDSIGTSGSSGSYASEYTSLFGSLPGPDDRLILQNVQFHENSGYVYARQSQEVIVTSY
jgi:hypothetical protein